MKIFIKTLCILLLFPFVISIYAQDNPKLVVGIVVDQMRSDYLTRFEKHFGNDGLKKLLKEGFECRNAQFNYIPTYTGPGHATIYTGATPQMHGIIANDWFDKFAGKEIYCAEDESVTCVPENLDSARMSPWRLKTSTIGDELILNSNFKSKVIGISLKDRAAVFPAGHLGQGAYWLAGENFVSSSYYMNELPDWVKKFNTEKRVAKFINTKWELLHPKKEYIYADEDFTIYEEALKGEKKPVFPHDLKKIWLESKKDYNIIKETPFGNTLVVDFALAALKEEGLGQDESPDLLALSFSSTDYCGHQFGIRSLEIEDMYARFDLEITRLIEALDTEIGKENYVLFLTADHGANENITFLKDQDLPGGKFDRKKLSEELNIATTNAFGKGQWILNVDNFQAFFNHGLLNERGINPEDLMQVIQQVVNNFHGIYTSWSASDLKNRSSDNPLFQLLQKGYHPKYSGDLLWVTEAGFQNYDPTGTTHGSGYTYDTQVALLWYGAGIPHGIKYSYTPITSIAPTLSMMLNIALPSGCNENPIIEILR